MENPDVIILDEPFNALDDSSLIFVKQKLLEIKEKNISTIIIASHDKSIIEEICDEVIQMQDGRII
jgi:ABC-2 type transport system ATP-binding protein